MALVVEVVSGRKLERRCCGSMVKIISSFSSFLLFCHLIIIVVVIMMDFIGTKDFQERWEKKKREKRENLN